MSMSRQGRMNFKRGQGHRPSPLLPNDSARDVLDRFGRAIELGDAVLYHLPVPLHAKVVEMVPELTPGAPPGLVRVRLASTITFHLQRGVIMQDLVLTHEVEPEMKARLEAAIAADGVPGAVAEAEQQLTGEGGDAPDPPEEGGDDGDQGPTH